MQDWFKEDVLKSLIQQGIDFLPHLIAAGIIFVIFWRLSYVASYVINRIGKARNVNSSLLGLMRQISWITVFVFGLTTSLNNLGVDLTALITSLGLTGFALSFALKDAISNVIAGVMVILYKTFKRGDEISVSGASGVVQEVNLRYTIIEPDGEGEMIYIPNSIMLSRQITVKKNLQAANSDDGYVIK